MLLLVMWCPAMLKKLNPFDNILVYLLLACLVFGYAATGPLDVRAAFVDSPTASAGEKRAWMFTLSLVVGAAWPISVPLYVSYKAFAGELNMRLPFTVEFTR